MDAESYILNFTIRKLHFEDVQCFRDVTPLEVQDIADSVTKRMAELEKQTEYADTFKLALLAAMSFAIDARNREFESKSLRDNADMQLDRLAAQLESSLRKPRK